MIKIKHCSWRILSLWLCMYQMVIFYLRQLKHSLWCQQYRFWISLICREKETYMALRWQYLVILMKAVYFLGKNHYILTTTSNWWTTDSLRFVVWACQGVFVVLSRSRFSGNGLAANLGTRIEFCRESVCHVPKYWLSDLAPDDEDRVWNVGDVFCAYRFKQSERCQVAKMHPVCSFSKIWQHLFYFAQPCMSIIRLGRICMNCMQMQLSATQSLFRCQRRNMCIPFSESTEMRFILCTWFGEVCSCSCLTVLAGPAGVLLNKIWKE